MRQEKQTAAVTHGCSFSEIAMLFLHYRIPLCARRPCCVSLDNCSHMSFVVSECERGCGESPWRLVRRHSEGTRLATLSIEDCYPVSSDQAPPVKKSVDCPERCEELCQDCARSPDQRRGLER